jgi:hypothetical protein
MTWLRSQRLSYSVGFTLADNTADLIAKIPEAVWTPAYDSHDEIRDGAWVAQLNGLLDLTLWPARMRVIARQETTPPRPRSSQLPDLELRHGSRARCEDRIRVSNAPG